MHSLVLDSLTVWRPLGYLLVFLGMVLEGDVILFATAFLTHQGFFSLNYALAAVLAGVTIGDASWYFLGARIRQSPARLFAWVNHIAAPLDDHLRLRPFHTLLISKFIYGFHHAILLHASSAGLSLRRFMSNAVLASLVWVGVIGSLGYVSSASFFLVRRSLRFAEIALLAGLILFVTANRLIAKPLKRHL